MCHQHWTAPDGEAAAGAPVAVAVDGGESMPGWRFAPAGVPQGSCVVVPDIYGPSLFYHEVARLLATSGFTATLVDYFFREGPAADGSREAAFARRAGLDEQRAIRDIDAAVEQFGSGPAARTGVIGFCLAGQLALDLCATRQDLATACFYPFPEGVAGPVAVAAPRPVDLAARITGPILAFWGDEDYTPADVIARFHSAMREAGADYTQHVYEGAGHSFLQGLVDDRPDSAAARDAWTRTLSFLRDALRPAEHAGRRS